LVREQDEIALLPVVAGDAHLVLEALEEGDAPQGELDLDARIEHRQHLIAVDPR
jgi:hypothetical protein